MRKIELKPNIIDLGIVEQVDNYVHDPRPSCSMIAEYGDQFEDKKKVRFWKCLVRLGNEKVKGD